MTSFGTFPSEIQLAILVGALAAAGAGGANNLVQSNWIRDKGFGMGKLRAAHRLPHHRPGGGRARRRAPLLPDRRAQHGPLALWWKRANLEQFVSFACVATITIVVFSLFAYSTVFQNPDLPDSSGFDFIALEASVLDGAVGDWFGTMFLAVGAISLFAAALGIVDYVSRLVADVIHTGYAREQHDVDREPPVLRRRVDDDRFGCVDPAARVRPAARAAHDLDRDGRRDHDRLHLPAAGHEPALSARSAPAGRLPGGVILALSVLLLGICTAIVAVDQIGNLL